MTEFEYHAEIREIAESARAEAREQGMDLDDYLHETIDGHQFVIYTYRAMRVVEFSGNHNAIFDELGDQTVECFENLWSAAAYFAMRADVSEALPDEEETEESEEA